VGAGRCRNLSVDSAVFTADCKLFGLLAKLRHLSNATDQKVSPIASILVLSLASTRWKASTVLALCFDPVSPTVPFAIPNLFNAKLFYLILIIVLDIYLPCSLTEQAILLLRLARTAQNFNSIRCPTTRLQSRSLLWVAF
jgi:hypothetical protein